MSQVPDLLPLEQLRLLRIICFAGVLESAEDAIGYSGDADAALNALSEQKLIETDGVIVATAQGEQALEAWYEKDRASLTESDGEVLHDSFRPLDIEVKSLASDWQAADAADDWDQRMATIEALTDLHGRVEAFFKDWLDKLPRLQDYRDRLVSAQDKVLDGETEFFVGSRVDSYHTAWFSLHEDLLRLLQREREDE